MPSPRYRVNEVFYSVQGEGMRAGEASVFVRFTGCNMRCAIEEGPRSPGGFDCDTEFVSGRQLTDSELVDWIKHELDGRQCRWLVLTGGEPGMQLDAPLIEGLKDKGFKLAVETNGSIALPPGLDWITVSPKVAEHAIRQLTANEVKYVRGYGQDVPKTRVKADHYLISPAFDGSEVQPDTMQWCMGLVLANPQWRLSIQQHKFFGVR